MIKCFSRMTLFAALLLCFLPRASFPAAAAEPSPGAEKSLTAIIMKDMHPSSFKDQKTGEPAGFGVDLMNAVAKQAGLTVSYIYAGDWSEVEKALQTGRADLCPVFSITEERKAYTLYTVPTETFGINIIIRSHTRGIRGIEDLLGRPVAVIRASQAYELLKEYPDIRLINYSSFQIALFDLLSGHADAFVAPGSIVQHLTRDAGIEDQITVLAPPLREIKRTIGVRKAREDLFVRISSAVQTFVASPAYHDLYVTWYGRPQSFWTAVRVLMVMGVLLVVAVIAMAGWRYVSLVRINNDLRKNIALRRAAENEIRKSQEMLENIFKTSPDIIMLTDQEGTITAVNDAVEKILGYAPHELIGAHSMILRPDEEAYANATLEMIRALFERGFIINFEFYWKKKQGGVCPLECSSILLKNDAGDITGSISFARDISGRRQADQALRESEQRFRTLLENANDAIFITDSSGYIRFWNRKAEKLYGYTLVEVIGKPHTIIVPPQFKEAHETWMQKFLAADPSSFTGNIIEGIGVKKSGEEMYVETSTAILQEGSDKLLVAIIRDITERKLAEEERARLLQAIEQAEEYIIIADAQGRIQYVNSITARKTGLPRESLINRNLFTTTVNGDQNEFLQNIFRTVSTGSIWRGRIQNHPRDGSPLELDTIITPVHDASGNIISYVSVSRDVTRELQLEQQLLQAQKMEAIGTLAGGIAHDFNNILAAIMGYTELSLQQAPEGTTLRSYLNHILQSSMRARDLVQQILAFSRKGSEAKMSVRISEIITEAVKLLRASIPSTIEIRVRTEAPSAVLHANPTQMHQMIMNLSTNAAQAMSEQGGILEIALSCVVLTDEDCAGCPDLQPGPYLKLQVRDTGTGIAPHHITRIFDPFFTTKEVGKGTGMGLAVVHGIVKNLGGDIRVHSELEKGTCFEVLLPSAEQAAQLSAPDIPAVRKGTERILLIDDEIKLLTVGKKQLEALGYVVTEKQSSLEALDLFQKNPYQFDLIITDQTMPRMTGDLLARKAMDIRPGMPVILCTGFSEKITKETAKKSGIRAFIMKPFRRSEIAATIREVLDSTET